LSRHARPRPAAPQPISKLAGAFALFGFGGSLCFAAFVLFNTAFRPGRHGPSLVPFRFDHPLALIGFGMAALGVILLIWGKALFNAAQPTPPGDFGAGR
jgi:hypothetical protein